MHPLTRVRFHRIFVEFRPIIIFLTIIAYLSLIGSATYIALRWRSGFTLWSWATKARELEKELKATDLALRDLGKRYALAQEELARWEQREKDIGETEGNLARYAAQAKTLEQDLAERTLELAHTATLIYEIREAHKDHVRTLKEKLESEIQRVEEETKRADLAEKKVKHYQAFIEGAEGRRELRRRDQR